ncbi:outer membrane beta-barrel protein [Flavobacterium caeni]|uniref:Outer membrane receptor proteins, mostly Fe transport n=1 Tax=Flavobacterium caeni TaxID=490189 RepID=A0A1G5BJX9_9FLAO|nr:outer membrane beta-barrel protein [Flavobacterium caeni]SCX90438.1 Outer membrane receptor proteins, mostly Fe transport [Flavobacterium caeni]
MKIIYAVVCLFCFGITSAQTAKISGIVKDSNQKPVGNILISLLQSTNQTLVKTEITQPDGAFAFENLQAGEYVITIDENGYQTFASQPISVVDSQSATANPVLTLTEAQQLSEVTVQKKKPLAEYKIDRTVVNVDAMVSSAGSDAMDVLEKSPGIIVDQNGTISFKGRSGVQVFIDDKPTYLSGSELEAYLKALPASTLDQIELITNPPAKYEAAGSAGIINIKTKKSKAKGFNGNYTARGSVGKRWHSRNGLSLNFMQGKVRVFGNAGYATQAFVTDLDIYRQFLNPDGSTRSLFDQKTLIERRNNTANLRLGTYFYATEKTTLGINLGGMLRRGNQRSDGSSVVYDAAGVLDSTIVAKNSERNRFKNASVNLNGSHEFAEGKKWSADVDYLRYDDKTIQNFSNYVFRPDSGLASSDESTGKLPGVIDIYAFKTDYSHAFPKDQTLDTGYKLSYSHTDNVTEYADVTDAASVPNYDMSNHFKYDEVIHAGYVNYSRNFKRWSLQAGLRVEHTISKGNQLGNVMKPASQFRRDYTNLFPTLYVQYKVDSIGNHQLVTSYGKRINRPYYQDLNPFVSPLDKFTFYTGNPYLNPSFSHTVELSYRYKSLFNTTVSYGFTEDGIDETLEIKEGVYYSRPGNLSKTKYVSWNIQSDIPVAQWWSANMYCEVTHMKYDSPLYTQYLTAEGTMFYLQANNRFKLGKGWQAELGGNVISALPSAQVGTRPKHTVNCGVQKKVLKDQGTIRFTVNDIFYSNVNAGTINNLQDTYANYENWGDTRYAALTFTYAFGKMFASKDGGERTGAESEQNRVK